MSEYISDFSEADKERINGIIGGTALKIVQMRNFMGYKVGREVMDEYGISRALDEYDRAIVNELFGVSAANGIVLAMRKTTDEQAISERADELSAQLHPEVQDSIIGQYIPYVVGRGVVFYQQERRTPKAVAWAEEFQLFRNALDGIPTQ